MLSNDHNSYEYPHHQQSSAHQYSHYLAGPASSTNAQPPRQYQPIIPAVTNQSADYIPHPEPSYGMLAGGYGALQDSTWSGSSNAYGTTRDDSSRAAKVLRNMNNTNYSAITTVPCQSGVTATNATTVHSTQYSFRPSLQVQAQPLHTSPTTYVQTQAFPHSVSTSEAPVSVSRGLSSPMTVTGYSSQQMQQRNANFAHAQHSNNDATAASRNSVMAATGPFQQYTEYSRRQLSDEDSSRSSHTVAPRTSYTPRPLAQIASPPPFSTTKPYTGSSTTIDPTAACGSSLKYQDQKAIRDTARVEHERKDEKACSGRERLEEEEQRWQAQIVAGQPKPRASEGKKPQVPAPGDAYPSDTGALEAPAGGSELEAEIRAMMAKMRELNGKDPQLLARIWEEERRAKVPNPSTATTNPVPQPAVVPFAQASTPPAANQRKKVTPQEFVSVPVAKPGTPVQAQLVAAKSQAAATVPVRSGGNTIWPSNNKLGLARAAAHYLTTKNPGRPLDAGRILQMLNGNPSYIELCEQLEHMGFKLDRSILAKSLLLVVPDVNSASHKTALQSVPSAMALKASAPPAIMKHHIATPAAPSPRYTLAAASPINISSSPLFPDNGVSVAAPSIPVAETIPVKPESKLPANKEEPTRKRNLSDLVDLTKLDEENETGRPRKTPNVDSVYMYRSPYPIVDGAMGIGTVPFNNIPAASIRAPHINEPTPQVIPMPARELRYRAVVEPLNKKKALRRNTYNPATIARDVLIACGRHPFERQLNQHLDVLKTNISHISNESDLSTIEWNMVDPGDPPPGYFKDGVQALIEDADDEDDSEDVDKGSEACWRSSSHAVGKENAQVQAFPEATNSLIKQKRCSQSPCNSPPSTILPHAQERQTNSSNMSASAPRYSTTPATPATGAGVGNTAFRSATEYGPDGKPLPSKKGHPVSWRKAIHGSATVQSRSEASGHAGEYRPEQPTTLRNVRTSRDDPVHMDYHSSNVANHTPQYQSFKCKWQNCKAELHNLDTLKKHVFKVHRKKTLRSTLECLWDDCCEEVPNFDRMTNMSLERHTPHTFAAEKAWHEHIQQNHFDPLAWKQGDGPADGLSDTHDFEVYLSDAQDRRVTPRITAGHERPALVPWGCSRPPKNAQEQDACDAQNRLVSQKKRMGGPGIDRGGATLVNDKRRRGLVNSDGMEEELVDAED